MRYLIWVGTVQLLTNKRPLGFEGGIITFEDQSTYNVHDPSEGEAGDVSRFDTIVPEGYRQPLPDFIVFMVVATDN